MKKVLALTMAAALAFGMTATAFAAPKADGVSDRDNLVLGVSQGKDDEDGVIMSAKGGDESDLADLTVTAGATVQINLNKDAFTWKDGKAPAAGDSLTSGMLTNLKVSASFTKGGAYWQKPVVKSSTKREAFIEIQTADWYTGTKDGEFIGKLTLRIKNYKTEIDLAGYIKNTEIEIDEDEEFATPSRFEYMSVNGYCKAIEIDLGNGLVYNTRLYEGNKYYIGAKEGIEAEDDDKVAKYDIDTVFTVRYTKNLETPSSYMAFDLDETYYVYDINGKLLGTTKDKVALSPKYYLAVNKLEEFDNAVAETTETPEEPTDAEAPVDATEEGDDINNPNMGGDDGVANENDNPGTGSNGLLNVAAVAGVVAIGAAAISMKK